MQDNGPRIASVFAFLFEILSLGPFFSRSLRPLGRFRLQTSGFGLWGAELLAAAAGPPCVWLPDTVCGTHTSTSLPKHRHRHTDMDALSRDH